MASPPAQDFDESFDDLFREHYPGLWRFVTRLAGAPDIAEELVQDVMFSVWRNGKWRRNEVNASFLYVSARNAFFNYQRRANLEDRTIRDGVLEWERKHIDTADVAHYNDLVESVKSAVDSLPDRCRLIFLMNREDGHSYSEIAEILGIAPKTVEVQMGRAIKTLRARLAGKLAVICVAAMSFAGRLLS